MLRRVHKIRNDPFVIGPQLGSYVQYAARTDLRLHTSGKKGRKKYTGKKERKKEIYQKCGEKHTHTHTTHNVVSRHVMSCHCHVVQRRSSLTGVAFTTRSGTIMATRARSHIIDSHIYIIFHKRT